VVNGSMLVLEIANPVVKPVIVLTYGKSKLVEQTLIANSVLLSPVPRSTKRGMLADVEALVVVEIGA